MQKSDVFNLTEPETLKAVYANLSQEYYAEREHALFVKGIFLGMEILAESIAHSAQLRKLLENTGEPE